MQLLMLDYSWVKNEQGLACTLTKLESKNQIKLKRHEQGADREQWCVESNNTEYLIFVEHLSESAWVELVTGQDDQKLQDFYAILFSDTAV